MCKEEISEVMRQTDYVRKRIADGENAEKAVDEAAELRYSVIHNLSDTVKASENGTTWYVSGKGRENALGNSANDPFDSITALERNRSKIKAGDAVLFHRDEVYRGGCITSVSGVCYGAYGEGEKPIINTSLRNHITDRWYSVDDGIWTLDVEFEADIGNVIFDDGVKVGVKKKKRADIIENFDFWSDSSDNNRLYIKLEQNPSTCFGSIEIAFNIWMFRLEQNSDITVENLSFCYGGGHGIRGSNCNNITVRGCEFRFIGGSFLTGYRDGTVRYGNAVEFMTGSCNVLVENCYIYEIYDSGITHQGLGDYVADGITFRNNLITRCGMGGIEYWLGQGSLATGVTYEGNIMRCAGFGFGGTQRPDFKAVGHIYGNGFLHNRIENFRIADNIFDRSTYSLIDARSKENTLPKLEGNIYMQNIGGRLGIVGNSGEVCADEYAKDEVSEDWGDIGGTVVMLPPLT